LVRMTLELFLISTPTETRNERNTGSATNCQH
jgi:hypothetical protein